VEDDHTLGQIQSLLIYSEGLARQALGKVCKQSIVEEVVHQLVLIVAKSFTPTLLESAIPGETQRTLQTAVQLLSASNFFTVILRLLGSTNDQVCPIRTAR